MILSGCLDELLIVAACVATLTGTGMDGSAKGRPPAQEITLECL